MICDNKKNILYDKSFKLAINIVSLYNELTEKKKEYVLSKQLLRSGTSIGANISESTRAQGKKDFISKLHVAFKEAAETEYWIKLLVASGYLERSLTEGLINDLDEIIRIINASTRTARNNLEK